MTATAVRPDAVDDPSGDAFADPPGAPATAPARLSDLSVTLAP